MKNILGLFILAIVLIGCAPSQVVPTSTLSPIPPTATATHTSTATFTPTITPSPTLSPTLTPTLSPYNLSFEYDGNWVFDQRWKYFYSEYSAGWKNSGNKSLKLFYENTSNANCEINPWDRVEVSGQVDLTNANYIVYDVMPINPEVWERWYRSRRHLYPLGLEIYIDNNLVSVLSEVPQELLGQYVSFENLTGIHTLKFVFRTLQGYGCYQGEFGIYIDNLRFLGSEQFLSSLPSMPTPIPTFADVSAEALLFSEDFEDQQVSGWTGGGLPGDPWYGNSWDIRDDVYGNHYWQGAGSYGWPQRFYAPKDWTDYALEVRFRDISPNKDQGGVLICIRSSDRGFYVANMGTTGYYQLAIYDGTEYRQLKGANRTFMKNQWYLVRLEAQGDEIRLFVDNELLMTVKDSTLSSGSIGFYIGSGVYIHIDDIRVWSLPSDHNPLSQVHPSPIPPTLVNTLQVIIEANQRWKDADISIKEGDKLQISHLSGTWRSSPDYSWGNGFQCTGTCVDCLLPTAPEGSLIAKVGDGDPFCVDSSSIVSALSGNLFLSFNDCAIDACFSDNEGSLNVQVEISP